MGTIPSVFAPGRAEQPIRGSSGAIYVPSSFGVDGTTFGPDFDPAQVIQGDRYRCLDYAHRFALNTQHDHKTFDWQGRLIRSGKPALREGAIGSSYPAFYVPLDQRRPSTPYRLAPLIIASFTGLLYGFGHAPKIEAEGDPETSDFVQALREAADLGSVMIRARDTGGGVGTVMLSWRFFEGTPRVQVHNGKCCVVHVWADQEALVPEHVSEIKMVAKDEVNAKGKRERVWYWQRRDWTLLADVVFVDQPIGKDAPKEWIVDDERTVVHGDGFAHVVWIPNLPDDDEATRIDGKPDCEGLWEPLNSLDALNSVVNKGSLLNLDPTLVLAVDPEIAKRGVRKGSENALTVGIGGAATYLELAGTSIAAGNAQIQRERGQILEVAQCVIPDPNAVAAAGTSGTALRLLYQPMTGKNDLLRTQYGKSEVRLLEQMIQSGRRLLPVVDEETGIAVYAVEVERDPETGEELETPVEYFLALPDKVTEEEVRGLDGAPTGEKQTVRTPRKLGPSEKLKITWPDYFPLTEGEKQAKGTTLLTATGGKPISSQRSAVEEWATATGRDPVREWARVCEEAAAKQRAEQGMFLGTGANEMVNEGTPPLPVLPVPSDAQPQLGEDEVRLPQPGDPEPEEEKPTTAEDVPPAAQDVQVSTAYVLNGAQIASAMAIVAGVVAGELPRPSGVAMLRILFNLHAEQAEEIMGPAGTPVPTTPNPVGEGDATPPAPAPGAPVGEPASAGPPLPLTT